MTADFTVGQQGQGTLQRCVGVMQDDELDPFVLVGGGVAAIDPQASGATCQGQQQEGGEKRFHGEGTVVRNCKA
ncbi:hypothetical protein D3C84_1228770 [compost metagenome]